MALQEQQYKMANLMNQMKLQDTQRQMDYAKAESGYARQLATDPDTMDLPPDRKYDLLMNNALTQGDTVRASEFATMATNMRNSQALSDQRKATAATKVLDSQEKFHNYVGGVLAAAADQGEEAYNEARMNMLQSGEGGAADRQALLNQPWHEGLGQELRMGAMGARQQARSLHEQATEAQAKKNAEALERNKVANRQLQIQKEADRKTQAEAKAKAGAGEKAPTPHEMEQAAAILKDSGLKGADYIQAQQDVVSTAKAIRNGNKNISVAQSMQMAAESVKKADTTTTTTPGGRFSKDTTATTYKMRGATPKDAINYSGKKEDLIPGRYYRIQAEGKTQLVQFTGTGFARVQ